jgi:hypothetical protein
MINPSEIKSTVDLLRDLYNYVCTYFLIENEVFRLLLGALGCSNSRAFQA